MLQLQITNKSGSLGILDSVVECLYTDWEVATTAITTAIGLPGDIQLVYRVLSAEEPGEVGAIWADCTLVSIHESAPFCARTLDLHAFFALHAVCTVENNAIRLGCRRTRRMNCWSLTILQLEHTNRTSRSQSSFPSFLASSSAQGRLLYFESGNEGSNWPMRCRDC